MPEPNPLTLSPGKRAFVTGQTGSGKTIGSIYFAAIQPLPVIVLDTKLDESFDRLPKSRIVEGIPDSIDLYYKEWVPAFLVVRPLAAELEPEILDNFLLKLHNEFSQVCILIDETYSVVAGGYPSPGLKSLLTRGRARKQTVILGAQRPTWIPLFALSEADAYAVYALNLPADRKRLYEITGERALLRKPAASYGFHWFANGSYAGDHVAVPRVQAPVSIPEPVKEKIKLL